MKKSTLICLIFLFGIQSINAQTLTVCGPQPISTETHTDLTVYGGTGPYTWYTYISAPCSEMSSQEACVVNSGNCFWMFGQCLVGSGDSSIPEWVAFLSGTTVSHPNYWPSPTTKVIDALGNELIFTHSVNNSNLETCSVLGIEHNNEFSNVSIFPNPNQGIVNINFGDLKNINLKVFNPIGQLIYHKENVNETIHQFELEEASGIYFLELSSKQGKQSYKLIIN